MESEKRPLPWRRLLWLLPLLVVLVWLLPHRAARVDPAQVVSVRFEEPHSFWGIDEVRSREPEVIRAAAEYLNGVVTTGSLSWLAPRNGTALTVILEMADGSTKRFHQYGNSYFQVENGLLRGIPYTQAVKADVVRGMALASQTPGPSYTGAVSGPIGWDQGGPTSAFTLLLEGGSSLFVQLGDSLLFNGSGEGWTFLREGDRVQVFSQDPEGGVLFPTLVIILPP